MTISDELREKILGPGKYYWSAYSQGRLARHLGQPKDSNPWRHQALSFRIYEAHWNSGWDQGV